MMAEGLRVGGLQVSLSEAEGWVRSYFDADANRLSRKPYASPAYDSLATGSDSHELNDGDLLAPTSDRCGCAFHWSYSSNPSHPMATGVRTCSAPSLRALALGCSTDS